MNSTFFDGLTMSGEEKKKVILAIVGFFFVLGLSLAVANNSFVRYRNDFFSRWFATTKLIEDGRNIYDPQNGLDVVTFSKFSDSTWSDFYYPAHVLIFIGPLSILPYSFALPIWLLLIQIFYVVSIWLIMDLVNWPNTINQRTMFLIMAILFLPYLQQTIWAQFNTIAALSLALIYLALRKDRLFLAGALASGLTFKPQGAGLVIVVLLLWSMLRKRRWLFIVGFLILAFFLWGIAEIIQPNWVPLFLASLNQYIPTQSLIDRLWNPYQLVSACLILGLMVVVYINRNFEADSSVFAALLASSFGVWCLIVPIVGMMHMVLLPVILVPLMKSLRDERPSHYRVALLAFGAVYILGWAGFFLGLIVPGYYGNHITWSELAYKIIVPIMLIIFSIPLCAPSAHTQWSPSLD